MFIEISKISNPEDNTQESLVLLLLYIKALGTLRSHVSEAAEQIILSPGMRLWADLPYFSSDMLKAWQRSRELSSEQRINFAAFTSRLIATDACGTELSTCALWLFREALETQQVFSETTSGDNGTPLALEMLFACITMLQHCSHKLLILCINNETPHGVDQDLITPGELAQQADIMYEGFSLERWLYWRKRFQIMSKSEYGNIREVGGRGFDSMVRCGREAGFKVVGENKWWEMVKRTLSEELKRSGKHSVSLEDIVTDPDWVD